jgi:tetratricopeptide (TPR) repeat protein
VSLPDLAGFEIVSLAGKGGMSTVYRARDVASGRIVALKVGDAAHPESLVREAAALAAFDHPAIVRHVAHDAATSWLAMEWLEGLDLRTHLKRGGSLAVPEAVVVATRIASALAHMHARGFVHRDVKPSNVLLALGSLDGATLIDFGLSRAPGKDATEAGLMLGTPGYMAPEQIVGGDVGPAADAYALGCTIFRMLHRAGPFRANGVTAMLACALYDAPARLGDVVPQTPDALGDIVDRMLLKSPDDRPRLDEVLEVLARVRALSKPPAPHRFEALSARELHIVSVIVAGAADEIRDEETTMQRSPGPADIDLEHLRAVATSFDANLTLLPNGALLAFLVVKATAKDLATRAARLALALELRLSDVPIVVVTGRAELGDRLVGEAIDCATAMMQSATRGAVTVDDVTAGLLDVRFELDGNVLAGERSTIDTPRTVLGRKTTSVGRTNDLGRMVDLFEEAVESRSARAALVTGPAGIGKSRLRHELTRDLQGQAHVWIGAADQMRGTSPFGVIAPMLRAAMGIAEGETNAWPKVVAAVGDSGETAVFLADLVGCEPPEADAHQFLVAARRDVVLHADQTKRAFCAYVRRVVASRPLLVVLEDLHWADAPSVALVTEALRALADTPLVVVAFARPDVTERFPNLWRDQGVRAVRLSPLNAWAGAKLVRQLLGDVPAAVVEGLVARAEGNPFFLEELVRAHAEGRADETPKAMVAIAQARLEHIAPLERRVLRAISVFGMTSWEGAVASLLGDEVERDALREAMKALEERELVVRHAESRFAGEVEHAFRHALVCEAAYSLLTDADRERGHRIAAAWLRDSGEKDSMVLAEHFDRGGEPEEAGPLYVLAAQDALEAYDPPAALVRAGAAERCGVSGRNLGSLRSIQAVAYRYHGDVSLAVSSGLEALRLLPVDAPDWTDALEVIAVNANAGAKDALDRLLFEVRGMLERGITPDGGVVAALAVEAFIRAGRHDVASEILGALAARDELFSDARCRATIHYAQAVMITPSNPSAARDLLERSVAAHEEAGNSRGASASRMSLAYIYAALGQYTVAEKLFRSTREARVALGLNVMVVDHNVGLVLARMGRLDEALEIEERATATAVAARSPMFEGFCRVYLAKIRRARGELAEAEREVRRAMALIESMPPVLASALAELAMILLEARRPSEALDASTRGMNIRETTGALEEGDVLLQVAHAEALLATGDVEAGRARAKLARRDVEQRAAIIADEPSRAAFMRVPENARAFELG